MNELAEALELLGHSVARLPGCNGSDACNHRRRFPECSTCVARSNKRQRARELIQLLSAVPAIISRLRESQMACLRALTRHDWEEARELAVSAELELERMESGFLTERLQVPGAPPATLRTITFDGVLCWTLRSEYTGELLYSGHVGEQPPGARTAAQVVKDSCHYKLRMLAQGVQHGAI